MSGQNDSKAIKQQNNMSLTLMLPPKPDRNFTFDSIIPENATQQHVFQYSGVLDLVNAAIRGYATTIFA